MARAKQGGSRAARARAGDAGPPPLADAGSPEAIIAELAAKIRHHRAAYYAGAPEVPDAEFDALEDRLRELAPDHPVLAEVGAPPPEGEIAADQADAPATAQGAAGDAGELAAAVVADASPAALGELLRRRAEAFYGWEAGAVTGPAYRLAVREYRAAWEALRAAAPDDPIFGEVPPAEAKEWPKARHEIPMGSLNKVNTPEELAAWAARCDELAAAAGLPPISGALLATEKLDGLSLELLYQDGRLEAAVTRGDGVLGELITANVRRMQRVPATIAASGRLSVRGEIVLKKSDAERMIVWKRAVDRHFEELRSLRNMAAGLARAKEPRYLRGVCFLTVVCYDLEGAEELATERTKLAYLRALGFEVPPDGAGDMSATLARFEEYAGRLRESLDYEIDGLVVRADDLRAAALLGELNNRPRAAVAFKFAHEMQVTQLLDILWSTGDTGRITPIAQTQPVFLAGAEVRQASLHNWANVKRLGIGIGDQVLVSRRNDVIPYVEKVEAKGPNEAERPEVCGACGEPVSVEGEYLVCRNDGCPARRVGRLRTWIRELGLLDWGEKTLERFFDAGLVQEPADLYRLTVPQIAELEGFGETSARRLLEPLAEKKEIPLAIFIAALGIETVSRETGKLLVGAGYESFEQLAAARAEDLEAIPGLGAIKAERILAGVRARLGEVARLREVGVVPVTRAERGPLAGLSFCFSGAHSRPRKVLQGLVETNGGTVAASVTKGLSYLVLADPASASSKAEKARKLGVEVIDEATLDALIAGGGRSGPVRGESVEAPAGGDQAEGPAAGSS